VLRTLLPVLGVDAAGLTPLANRGEVPTRNTRGDITGVLKCSGSPRFLV